ncbi:hypothetical protein [Seonamhaeicola marinus]|uniref:DUF1579 domain-containing protein n=1 Tax=Seonamhaeicola marinus TaxID=1912246 RepID=A0A5D0J9A4_9FLAO|nr:hypothetical protein [Seonamhaeicola marinus]TYA92091.1 hypothetical protein FUA24_01270 [Seonamhaeicola marinus]
MKNLVLGLLLLFSLSSYTQNNSCKCCTENHDAFDFWVGEWEVFNKNESVAGYNSIIEVQNNCVIRENWKSAKGGFTGTSNSFYNLKKQQWEQIWVDNQGGVLHLKGNRTGNQMILKTDLETNAKGQSVQHVVTWTKNSDGTVRQYWETITDGKQTTIAFDGLYKKTE